MNRQTPHFLVGPPELPPPPRPWAAPRALVETALADERAAGALELAGNLPSFQDNIIHPTINVEDLDPECALANLVINEPRKVDAVKVILNNSFGMLGINSALILKKFED